MTSRVCPKCKAPADAGDAFCRRCGAAIPKEPPKPVCPKCGRELTAGDRFCPGCGADLAPGASQKPAGKTAQPGIKPLAVTLAAAALLVCVGIGALLSGGGEEPGRPAAGGGSGISDADASGLPAVNLAETSAPWRDNVLMADPAQGDTLTDMPDSFVFGSDITRREIGAVTFVDTTEHLPEERWDVSQAQDGSVMAGVSEDGDLYYLFIAADGGVAAPEDCSGLFQGYANVEAIHFAGAFHTENTTSMSSMFRGCAKLEDLDLEGIDTSSVTDMSSMFSSCDIVELDAGDWDTSRVEDMSSMFYSCGELAELELNGWDTSSVTDMGYMFFYCENLTALDLSGWDTSSVTDMHCMFQNCKGLERLNCSGWDVSGVSDMRSVFRNCGELTRLSTDGWEVPGSADTEDMFSGCGVSGLRGGGGSTATEPSGGQGTVAPGTEPVIQDPDTFFQNKLIRNADATSDTGGYIEFETDYGHNAFQEYAEYLAGGDFPLELVSKDSSNPLYDYFYFNYTGSSEVQKATSGGGLSAYDLVVVITHIDVIDVGRLQIYYGEGISFDDFGGRCKDTSFKDESGGDTKTGHFIPGQGVVSGGSPSSGGGSSGSLPSSGDDDCYVCGGTGRIECPDCGGSGKEVCSSCRGSGGRYVTDFSSPLYDGVGSADRGKVWKECTSCWGDGVDDCSRCYGRGEVDCYSC